MSFLIELEYPAAYERQPSRRLPLARRFSIGSALRRLRLLLLAPVVALLSDWFPATTGEMIHVDGGLHSTGA